MSAAHRPSTAMSHRSAAEFESTQSAYAMRIAARLSDQAQELPPEVNERLRFARTRALEHARAARVLRATVQPRTVAVATGGDTLALGRTPRSSSSWWIGPLSLLPLLALVAGLVLIQSEHVRRQVAAAAEVDADLLLDDLPPAAYRDPGFVEFLKHQSD